MASFYTIKKFSVGELVRVKRDAGISASGTIYKGKTGTVIEAKDLYCVLDIDVYKSGIWNDELEEINEWDI